MHVRRCRRHPAHPTNHCARPLYTALTSALRFRSSPRTPLFSIDHEPPRDRHAGSSDHHTPTFLASGPPTTNHTQSPASHGEHRIGHPRYAPQTQIAGAPAGSDRDGRGPSSSLRATMFHECERLACRESTHSRPASTSMQKMCSAGAPIWPTACIGSAISDSHARTPSETTQLDRRHDDRALR